MSADRFFESELVERAAQAAQAAQSGGKTAGEAALPWPVLGWREIRALAESCGLTPRQGEMRALGAGVMPSRYTRHARLLTLSGQYTLRASGVLIAGCGGLGCMTAEFLARMGIGSLTLVDEDRFEDSNLNRQTACTERTLGRLKAEVLGERLREINSAVETRICPCRLTPATASDCIRGCRAVVDALDNPASRGVVHRIAFARSLPVIYGALDGYDGETGFLDPETAPPGEDAPPPVLDRTPDAPPFTVAATAAFQTAAVVGALLGLPHGQTLTFLHLDSAACPDPPPAEAHTPQDSPCLNCGLWHKLRRDGGTP